MKQVSDIATQKPHEKKIEKNWYNTYKHAIMAALLGLSACQMSQTDHQQENFTNTIETKKSKNTDSFNITDTITNAERKNTSIHPFFDEHRETLERFLDTNKLRLTEFDPNITHAKDTNGTHTPSWYELTQKRIHNYLNDTTAPFTRDHSLEDTTKIGYRRRNRKNFIMGIMRMITDTLPDGRTDLQMILDTCDAYDYPYEAACLALTESARQQHAGSSKGARGYRQFISQTAEDMGLTVNDQIDERIDKYASTSAAIQLLTNNKTYVKHFARKQGYTLDDDEITKRAIILYNGSPSLVFGNGGKKAFKRSQGKIENYIAATHSHESRNYLPHILSTKQLLIQFITQPRQTLAQFDPDVLTEFYETYHNQLSDSDKQKILCLLEDSYCYHADINTVSHIHADSIISTLIHKKNK